MPTTPNKGYEVQVTGTNVDTWGDVLNDDTISIIDENLGGITTKTLASSNVNLTAEESQTLIVRLTGTISANIAVTTLAFGMTIVENLTSGAFAVTFALNGVGSPVTISQGTRAVIVTDGTNGARPAASNAPEFSSGTVMLFRQANAPTGWTGDAAAWNHAIRMVAAGSGGGTGGSVAFTTAFANQSVEGTVGATALTIDQIPAHTHTVEKGFGDDSNPASNRARQANTASGGASFTTSSIGGSQTHNHSFTGTAINLAVSYATCIFATKD